MNPFSQSVIAVPVNSEEGRSAKLVLHKNVDVFQQDTNQGQKYSVGQEFKAHHDYFTPNSQEYLTYCQHAGQRTWTFMIYLNDTPAGGGTRFRKLEKTFYPKQGMAVLWNNLKEDGSPNPYTLHHGMKVREGEKYVITKWFRERGWGPMFLEDRSPSTENA